MFISVEFLEDFVIPAKVAAELEIIGKPVDRVTGIPIVTGKQIGRAHV